jgi:hypothetical protein
LFFFFQKKKKKKIYFFLFILGVKHMTSRGVQAITVAVICSKLLPQPRSPVMPILTTATATGRPVAVFTNCWLSDYFKQVINQITDFLLLLQFLIFFNKKNQYLATFQQLKFSIWQFS